MRILLIKSCLGRKEPPILPFSLAYMTNNLDGREVSILNSNTVDNPFDSTRNKLVDFKRQAIGISLRNIDMTRYKDMYYNPQIRLGEVIYKSLLKIKGIFKILEK